MRLVMMSTGPFGASTLRRLYDTGHEVVALVTAPLRRKHTRGPAPTGTVRELASQHNTAIFDPPDVNCAESRTQLIEYQADLLVVCDYGQILTAETLATTRLGGINLHGSLLPKYRGAAPVNWAIYHGENETGVSIIHMTPKLDAGPVIARERTAIDSDETADQLEARLSEIGARLIAQALDDLESDRTASLPQDPSLASKAPRLKKTDGLIDWSRWALAVKNHIRSVQPWPKAYTFLHRPDGPPLRLIVGQVTVAADAPQATVAPGTILETSDGRLTVATGGGAVSLTSLQPAGKRMLPVKEFLRGYRVEPGHRFGPE